MYKNSKKLTDPILLVGVAKNCPDIQYITQFSAPDPMVFLQYKNQRHLIVPMLEYERARRQVKRTHVYCPDDFKPIPEIKGSVTSWVVGLLKKLHVRRVHVPMDFPVGIAHRLKKHGINYTVLETATFPQRQIKTPGEIKNISMTQHAAITAMNAAIDLIRSATTRYDGALITRGNVLTAERVRTEIHRTLMEFNCQATGTIVACGKQAVDPHEVGHGPLMAHQPIVIDIFPQNQEHGYWGDLTRTVVKGRASKDVHRMYQAVWDAQQKALDTIRAGVSGIEVHQTVCATFKAYNFTTGKVKGHIQGFIHSTGHGVGLEIHELPSLSLRGGDLKAGHVITVEPGLYYRNAGGIRIEDLILVTEKGWRYLGTCEKTLEV